jgi:hypothetical protein
LEEKFENSQHNIYRNQVYQNLVSCDSMALKFEPRDPSFENDLLTRSKPRTAENTSSAAKPTEPDFLRCFPLLNEDHRPPEKRLHLAKIPIFGHNHSQNGRKA